MKIYELSMCSATSASIKISRLKFNCVTYSLIIMIPDVMMLKLIFLCRAGNETACNFGMIFKE